MLSLLLFVTAADSLNLFPPDKKPNDKRLSTIRTLNDKDFFLKVPATREAWLARAQQVREQILVSQGLWPLPPRDKLAPVIHGRVDRPGYSVERVYFASMPGHYVTGSLYRPRTKEGNLPEGKLPAVLVAHGHWANGRMHDAGEAAAKRDIANKAESHPANARYFLQAKAAHLARLGCVVFQYDMVGYADSTTLGHAAFADAEAELRLQNLMGLQTWNSMRALDFLAALPEVDGKRIAMTGASGGGTQTFLLSALDERIAVAVPAVMVSTAMQGGCVCENASYLRIGTGNVEFAALTAPRPLALTAANDWTIEIEKKGYPELQAVWKLFDAPDKVQAKCWPEFGHNYNQPARMFMYEFLNQHLRLGHKPPLDEPPFEPLSRAEQTVFTADHPRPADSLPVERLREKMTAASDEQMDALLPRDAKSLREAREVLFPALRVLLGGGGLPDSKEVFARITTAPAVEGYTVRGYLLGIRGSGEQVPAVLLRGKTFNGTVLIWIHPSGKAGLIQDGRLLAPVRTALDSGAAILAPDVFDTGELKRESPPAVNPKFAGYTFGYNRPLLSQRCHDILTTVVASRQIINNAKHVHLLGEGEAGPWVLLARGLCGQTIHRCAVDLNGFRFEKVRATTDPMMLPGALKYGGLGALGSLAAPGELYTHHHQGTGTGKWLKAAYKAADAESKLESSAERVPTAKVVEWLLR
jgi:dienelactone hydrolase